jgi:hypothetical protein
MAVVRLLLLWGVCVATKYGLFMWGHLLSCIVEYMEKR